MQASARPTPTWRPPTGDLVLAAAFAAIGVTLTLGVIDGNDRAGAVALTVAHALPIAWRRVHPEAALAAMGATAVAYVALGWPPVGLGVAVLAGVHALGATRDRLRAAPVLAATIVVMAAVVRQGDAHADTIVGNAAGIAVAWWLGDRQRTTRERAERAEREVDARAERAVAEERLRIARELHDVVAHTLSVIAVQAGTGRVVLDDDPATARSALGAIETESRAALGEMRRLLHVLRSGDDDAGPLAPSPGLGELDTLVAATVRSGLPVEVRIEGDPAPLPAGVELAAYRIVQEALTNVRRHAAASRASVRVSWRPDAVEVEVLDDGHGSGPADTAGGEGHGLVGMRERAALYGGTLDAGNRPGGGFRVAATIPREAAG